MPFKVGDQVVHPAFGIGRVVSRLAKTLSQAPRQDYYEVAGPRSTIWVPVAPTLGPGLRRLTRKDELARYRDVLCDRPAALSPDFRQRRVELRNKAREGTLLAVCEVVRDLSARSWLQPLNDCDANVLRRSRRTLCEEWAAANDVSLPHATEEVNALLRQGRQAYPA